MRGRGWDRDRASVQLFCKPPTNGQPRATALCFACCFREVTGRCENCQQRRKHGSTSSPMRVSPISQLRRWRARDDLADSVNLNRALGIWPGEEFSDKKQWPSSVVTMRALGTRCRECRVCPACVLVVQASSVQPARERTHPPTSPWASLGASLSFFSIAFAHSIVDILILCSLRRHSPSTRPWAQLPVSIRSAMDSGSSRYGRNVEPPRGSHSSHGRAR